jgi:hypothetical protein
MNEYKSSDVVKFNSPDLYQTYLQLEKKYNLEYQLGLEVNHFLYIFLANFVYDQPQHKFENGNYGAQRSNWTYHTAVSMLNAAKSFNLNCIFETQGKRDAIIQTKDDKPQTIIYAEWEWNHNDVFGKGKELEKLLKSVIKDKNASAFLFTYVPFEEYAEFCDKIIIYWQSKSKGKNYHLALSTVITQKHNKNNMFKCLRTVHIFDTEVAFWKDLYL